MPLGGARADEELPADLLVREALTREASDLKLLGGEVVARLHGALAGGLAGGAQLAPGALGECLDAHGAELVVGVAQLDARIDAAALTAQPLAVDQLGTGEVHAAAGAREPFDRLTVQALGHLIGSQERARPGLEAEGPVAAAGPSVLAEPVQRGGGLARGAGADARLDELGQHPRRRGDRF